MAMTEPVTATEAEVEKVTREKLVEDLRAVVADAEELLKATALRSSTSFPLMPFSTLTSVAVACPVIAIRSSLPL